MLVNSLDVSVIVISYNSVPEKLFKTIDSIIFQRGVSFEIIICDDGSEIQFENRIREYFSENNFEEYSLIFHDINRGTVSNFYSGLVNARGKYTKIISPGDYLAGSDILYEWVRYLEKNEAEWGFSDAYYYCIKNGKDTFLRKRATPQMIRPYLKNFKDKCIWNYIALHENANGATMFGKTETILTYCKAIKDNGIIYTEDLLYFLMMFDGIVGCYYPRAMIYYEHGTGISTSNNEMWHGKIHNDVKKMQETMRDANDVSDMQKEIIKTFAYTRKIEKILIRGKLYLWIKRHFFPRLTEIPKKGSFMVIGK